MKRIVNEAFNETYYVKKLDNGLEVVIYHKPEFKTTACAFGTPFGALDLIQSYDGKTHQFHSGLAHFLEHKLFESDQQDNMLKFNALGANVNAFTSYDATIYYFTTTSDHILEPLELLLDFVQSLSISTESVEKEKGIIVQELMMYQQMPEFRLMFETYKALYHNLPLKYDIGGSTDDVMAISKDELETCYRLNYHPSKMKLIIASPVDPAYLMSIIEDNQNNKHFDRATEVSSNYEELSKEVVNERVDVAMDIVNPKVALAFKFEANTKMRKDSIKEEWALQLFMEMTFTSVNPAYQKWLDEGIINSFFGVEVEYGKGYRHLLFYNETKQEEAFRTFILNEIEKAKTLGIDEERLTQVQRRFYGLAFKVFDDVENTVVNHMRYAFDDMDYSEVVKMILAITKDDISSCLSTLDLSHHTIVKIDKID